MAGIGARPELGEAVLGHRNKMSTSLPTKMAHSWLTGDGIESLFRFFLVCFLKGAVSMRFVDCLTGRPGAVSEF